MNVNAREKRKARRTESRQTAQNDRSDVLVDNVDTYTISAVERYTMANPCPRCQMVELRRIAGTDILYCHRCKQ